MEITEELKAEAKTCKTAEELLALAVENGIELTGEEAQLILGSRIEGRLADEELDGVAGGVAGCKRNAHEVVYFKSCVDVVFLFNPGDIVQAFVSYKIGNATSTVEIIESTTDNNEYGWYDVYKFSRISGAIICDGWQKRDRFEK